jgi:hypothetical protein
MEVTLAESAQSHKSGDVNHDGDVNVTDVTNLIAYILGDNDVACPECADFDGNGIINVADVTTLIAYILAQAE